MSKKIYSAALAGSFCVVSLAGGVNPAVADDLFGPDYRPYVSASGGWQTRNRSVDSEFIWADWKNGYDFNLAAGLKLYKLFRVDIEWSRLTNDAKTVSAGPGAVGPATGGTADLTAYTINAYVDYPIPNMPIEIFGGVGYGTFRSELSGLTNGFVEPLGYIFTGTSQYASVFQARAGLTYNINDNLQLYADYRYFDGGKLKFHFYFPNGEQGDAGPKDTTIQSGEIGVRYLF